MFLNAKLCHCRRGLLTHSTIQCHLTEDLVVHSQMQRTCGWYECICGSEGATPFLTAALDAL